MRSDDDDEADIGGPPPDPSLRAWRHPSELASAAAAARRPITPPRSHALGPAMVSIVAVGVAATLIVGVGALTSSFDDGRVDVEVDSVVGVPIPDAGTSGAPLSAASAPTSIPADTEDDDPSSGGDQGGTGRHAGDSREVGEAGNEGTSGDQPRAGTLIAGAEGDDPTEGDADADAGRARPFDGRTWAPEPNPTMEAGDGVFSSRNGTPRRLASFTVVDGIIYTSASAISDHDDLSIVVENHMANATVAGTDRYTDIAIIELSDADLAHVLEQASSVWSTATVFEPPRAGDTVTIQVPDPMGSYHEAVAGVVLSDDQPTIVPGGTTVYGSVLTTAYRPDGGSGGALVGAEGDLLGVVVNSTAYLAAAVPLDRVTSVGENLQRWQLPALEWLGVKGRNLEEGGVLLSAVIPDSPAEAAGLRSGHEIAAIDDVGVLDWDHLVYLIRLSGLGTTVAIEIDGRGLDHIVEATIGSRLDATEVAIEPTSP